MIHSLPEAILNVDKGRNNLHGDPALNNILYSLWQSRYSETIDAFYMDFIANRLPNPSIVLKWHQLLLDYSDRPGAVFPIRDGNTKNSLRRGWLVRVNGNFSYIFTDNDLAVYIYKMVLDGYCPTVDEFYAFMTEFKKPSDIGWLSATSIAQIRNKDYKGTERHFISMPVHFNRIGGSTYPDNLESVKNAYINTTKPAPVCCLSEYGYKHAHLTDVKGVYEINKTLYKWKDIKADLGMEQDYVWDNTINNFVWNRTLPCEQEDDLKKILKAHFLRFLDPLNHFLAPLSGNNKYTKANGDYSLDIAEYEHLQKYIIAQKEILFGLVFTEYMDIIFAPKAQSPANIDVLGAEKIDVIYHEKSISKKYYKISTKMPKPKKAKSAPAKAKSAKSSTATLGHFAKQYTYDQQLETAAYYFKNNVGLIPVEENHLKLFGKKGWVVRDILNVLGINTNGAYKGLLLRSHIDDAIDKATDQLKTTLEDIKKRGLHL